MSTQVTGMKKRFRMSALVALALAAAFFVLATQAKSIWSTRPGSQVQPAPAGIVLSANPDVRQGSHIPCRRPKWGCQQSVRISRHISTGCRRPKWGCQQSGSTTGKRP
jgi:hypothetical protein